MTGLALGVLASGGGSNLRALIEAHEHGELSCPIVLVISNNSKAGALQIARNSGIAAAHISDRTHDDPGAAILAALREHGVQVLLLAGYMKHVDPRVVAAYEGHALNIHPGPLPRFGGQGMYGEHVHRAVLAAGVPTSGPTIHRLTAVYDEGEIVAHKPVDVRPGDTLATLAHRVLMAEHNLYWRTVERLYGDGDGAAPPAEHTPPRI